MITELRLSEFKAFRHEAIELRPLTVFVGENNSGKSSVLAALRLMAQTIQGQDLAIPLAFNGAFGDFGSYRDVVHGNHRGRPIGLGLSVRRTPKAPTYSFDAEFKYRLQRREIRLRSCVIKSNRRRLLAVESSKDGGTARLSHVRNWEVPDSARGRLGRAVRMFNFIPRASADFYTGKATSPEIMATLDRLSDVQMDGMRAFRALTEALRSVEYIGAMRKAPERTYINTGVAGRLIGADGANWPAAVALESSRRGEQDTLPQDWAESAGLAADIKVSWLSDRHYEIMLQHPESGEYANIADVGQGSSQVLPVVVGGSQLSAGDTFIVEEPEIHLHPRAQAALGE
ncbi:hypothetical protein B7486_57675, partial [cyanobacterium TDX16]